MKNIFTKNFAIIASSIFTFTACVSDDSYSTPSIIDGGGDLTTQSIPFGDNFEAGTSMWQFINKTGTNKWESRTFNSNNYIQMSAFSSGTGVTVDAYAISPRFDFDAQENEYLEFTVADGYSTVTTCPLHVFYSTDYDGNNFSKATWNELIIPNANTLFDTPSGYDSSFDSSGKIDLSSITGKAVIAISYNSNQGSITSTAQVDDFVIGTETPNVVPTVTNLSISGNQNVNEILTGAYTFEDSYGGSDMSTYKWYRADDSNGTNKTEIAGATATTYITQASDLNKYISFEVTPNDGIDESTPVLSTYVGPIQSAINQAPTASNVNFTGGFDAGQTLTATYTYSDPENSPEGTSTYKWYTADDTTGTNATAISGATATTLVLTNDMRDKYISFEVIPNDGIINGTAVRSTFQGPVVYIAPTFGLINGGFESGLSDFTLFGNPATEETDTVHGGSKAAKHTLVSATSSIIQEIAVTPGDTITISMWYNVLAGDGTDARIWSTFLDASSATITDATIDPLLKGPNNAYFSSPGGTTNGWQQYTVSVVVPANAATLQFQVRSYKNATVIWDDFSITK